MAEEWTGLVPLEAVVAWADAAVGGISEVRVLEEATESSPEVLRTVINLEPSLLE